MNQGAIGIHDVDFHRSTVEPLASEVERVDVDCPIAPLHDSGDELLGMQGLVGAGQDLPHGAQVSARKPGHSSRVDVKLTEPQDARYSARERFIDLVRVVLIA